MTDGCPGLGAAIQTVYPRVLHQRCWVHKMRNILEKVRRRDYDQVKAGTQAIYQAGDRKQAQAAFRRFRTRWQKHYSSMVRQLESDLPDLLSLFSFPSICGVSYGPPTSSSAASEVRCRTRPMVCFVNIQSVDSHYLFHLPQI